MLALLARGSAVALVACSAAGSVALPAAAPPAPSLLQYAGEYDAPAGSAFDRVVLHADGTLEATSAGDALAGVYVASGAPGDATASAQLEDGRRIALTFAATLPADAPAQPQASFTFADGSRLTLTGPWLAGGESMCDATGGTWHDDDPDPATGLLCTCAERDVYMPSRGGCVHAPEGAKDPDRRALSDAAQDRAGSYEGTDTITSLVLSRDGSFQLTAGGEHDEGTWWDAPPLTGSGLAIDCTGAAHAFHASFQDDGSLTLSLAGGRTETLLAGR